MNAFMPWVGGKRALREQIVSMFPVFYERYIEVFGGAGWVLFHKNPGNDFEVYMKRSMEFGCVNGENGDQSRTGDRSYRSNLKLAWRKSMRRCHRKAE